MKRFFSGVIFLVAALFVSAVAAQEGPDVLVRNVTNEVLTIVKQDRDLQNGDTRRAMELVDAKVLPHFSFARMTALAVGREWNKASPQQKEQLTREFRTLLVRTYSNALTQFRNQTVDFKPFKMQPGETEVTVRTLISQPGSKPVELDYSLEKQGNGWKVYDVIVAGVSLVTNYRETFNQEIRVGGIDGLTRTLMAKNSKTAEKK